MYLFTKLNISKTNFFSLMLATIPLSFVAGNMIININVILIILSVLILFGKDFFYIKFNLLDKVIVLFFIFILVTGIYNDLNLYLNHNDFAKWRGYFHTIIKSLLFFKYLLLYFSLRFLIEKKFLNLKFFFISCTFTSVFVCLDILLQFAYGKDIFGFEAPSDLRKLGGPFGDELIAGSFIQRFSIFSFFVIPLFYNKISKKILIILIPSLFIIFSLGLIFSGNRMPLLLFILLVFLIIIFQKQTRKYFFPFILFFTLIFFLIFNFDNKVRANFKAFYDQISKIVVVAVDKKFYDKNIPQYLKEFASFYDTWRLNKYIGGGIKNFRFYCHVRENIDPNSKFVCNMHPHNYYLEILTETGLIGFVFVVSIFISVLYFTFFKKYILKTKLTSNKIIIPFIFLFVVEIFPIKSTGSFFTTGNATYLFLILAILVGLSQKDNLIKKKNNI